MAKPITKGKHMLATDTKKGMPTAKAYAVSVKTGQMRERLGVVQKGIERTGSKGYKNGHSGNYLTNGNDLVNQLVTSPKVGVQTMPVNKTRFDDDAINQEFDLNSQMMLAARVVYEGYDETYEHSTDEDKKFILQYRGMSREAVTEKMAEIEAKLEELVLG